VEAARGMGMTPWQLLRIVELPLAAPVIAAGIRTASVWTVGTATLATPIGQACLGNYIFAGLQTRNGEMLLIGVAAAAALALLLDAILAAAERAVSRHPRGRLAVPGVALALLVAVGIGILPGIPAGAPARAPAAAGRARTAQVREVRIGAKTFTEQYILAEVLRQRLAGRGIAARVIESLGSNVVFEALRRGDLDTYVDYSGTLWTTQLGRTGGAPRWQILAEVEGQLAQSHVRSLGPLGFQNAYAIAVRRDTATRLGLHGIGDLAPHAAAMALGTDYEFGSRREWAAVRAAYGLAFRRTVSFDPSLLYEALRRGEVDAISAFSSDGRIAAYDLVVLDDPAGALPSYDAMTLLGPRVADDPDVVCALAPLGGALPVELVRRANLMVDRDHASPKAAAAWLLGAAAVTETCAPAAPGPGEGER
ncbi:MAG TPA: glycine betaine ABC transporter substrate-binding protein, partial [Kofleriaceae bacterium]